MQAGRPSHKLGLGTVQFGLDYGTARPGRRVPVAEVRAMLRDAATAGVRVLDTAPAYGRAERLLGELGAAAGPLRVVTKTPTRLPQDDASSVRKALAGALQASLERLGAARVYGLLVHEPDLLLSAHGDEIFSALRDLREAGCVERIGVSVYAPEQLAAILERHPVELVQLPLSVLDQRMRSSGMLARLREAGVEVHARSSLLQGALTLPPEQLPEFLAGARSGLEAFRAAARARGLTSVEAAVGFVASFDEVDTVICGALSRRQLAELIAASRTRIGEAWVAPFARREPALIDPRHWPEAAA